MIAFYNLQFKKNIRLDETFLSYTKKVSFFSRCHVIEKIEILLKQLSLSF